MGERAQRYPGLHPVLSPGYLRGLGRLVVNALGKETPSLFRPHPAGCHLQHLDGGTRQKLFLNPSPEGEDHPATGEDVVFCKCPAPVVIPRKGAIRVSKVCCSMHRCPPVNDDYE